ncbi:MAG: hypothetical protein R3F13_06300 [Prosthecobacter sp.]
MNAEDEIMHVVPVERHNATIAAAYRARGYDDDEIQSAVRIAQSASWHGVRTHNGIKALSLDDHFGSKVGGCVPRAEIEKLPGRFAATEVWNQSQLVSPWLSRHLKTWCRSRRQIRHRPGVGGQCLPLPVGRRLRHGGGTTRLRRLHQLHLRQDRRRSFRWQAR